MKDQKPVRTALILRIEKAIPTLCKSEQIVASYIVNHAPEITSSSVATVADNCGVSDPTVVRTCQKLGFSGYHSLKLELARSLENPEEDALDAVKAKDNLQDVVAKVFQSCLHTIQFTQDTLDMGDLESVAQMLMHAKNISILSGGTSIVSAQALYHKLLPLGLSVELYTDPYTQIEACNRASNSDAVFALSHSGRSKFIVDSAQIAKDNGAKIITLTNSGRSPLSKIANISLFTTICEAGNSPLSSASHIADFAIIDALCTYIALRTEYFKNMTVCHGMSNLEY